MAQSIDHCDGSNWCQPKSSAREPDPVGGRFYLALLVALAIEAGVGALVWVAIYVT
jgi:hypothetical protein